MVAAEAAAAGSPPLVARHSGLAEVAAGLEEAYPERLRHLASFETGDAADLARKLNELLALPAAGSRRAQSRRPSRGRRAVVVDERRAEAARSGLNVAVPRPASSRLVLPPMGEEQRVSLAGASRDVTRCVRPTAPISPLRSKKSSRSSIPRRSN